LGDLKLSIALKVYETDTEIRSSWMMVLGGDVGTCEWRTQVDGKIFSCFLARWPTEDEGWDHGLVGWLSRGAILVIALPISPRIWRELKDNVLTTT